MATLYRKYRGRRFDDIIGQDPIVTTLTNQIKLGRIGHAYLFSGSRGIGKTSCARIFARAVNCLHPVNGSPCGECEVCRALDSDNVDIIEMDAASNNGVDDARDIREKVKYLPVSCKYKVYIIDEVHMLTGGAFNALLKTIEEPPEHVIFILATTEPQKLPQTILSRCIRFDFRLVPTDVLAKHIASVYDREGIKYTADAVEEIARQGEGSVRDALSIADTVASAAEVVTFDTVLSLTGAGDSAAIAELFENTASANMNGVLTCIDKLAKSGKSMSAVCRQLIDYTRNVLVAKSVGREKAASGIINVNKSALDGICDQAEKHDMDCFARMLSELGGAESGLKYSVNPRVFLETTFIKLVYGSKKDDDILKRLSALEHNSAGKPAEQKKNNQALVRETPTDRIETTPAQAHKPVAPKAPIKSEDNSFEPPPLDDYPEPEYCPPPEEYGYDEPKAPPKKSAPSKNATPKNVQAPTVSGADEGEFRHLSAQSETGLELLGKISVTLRKSSVRNAARVRTLLLRGVSVKERSDVVSFVSPDDVYLSMGEEEVVQTLNGVLESIGIKKRARIDRTVDDLREEDIAKAVDFFGVDCVIV